MHLNLQYTIRSFTQIKIAKSQIQITVFYMNNDLEMICHVSFMMQ